MRANAFSAVLRPAKVAEIHVKIDQSKIRSGHSFAKVFLNFQQIDDFLSLNRKQYRLIQIFLCPPRINHFPNCAENPANQSGR